MATSISDVEVRADMNGAKSQAAHSVMLDGASVEVGAPFPSPQDWRDQWIYFLMLDRFNNPAAPPRQLPYDSIDGRFQGGSYNGVRQQLPYLKDLGVGAI